MSALRKPRSRRTGAASHGEDAGDGRRGRGRGRNRGRNRGRGRGRRRGRGQGQGGGGRSGGGDGGLPELGPLPDGVAWESCVGMVDIGANLAHKSMRGRVEEFVARSGSNGVGAIIITGTSVKDSETAAAMAVEAEGREAGVALVSTAGVHPHDAKRWDAATAARIEALLADDHVVAVGECGLDYNRMFSTKDEQVTAFRAQLEIAARVAKPLFLHERDAWEPFVEILAEYWPSLPAGGVVHCFTSPPEALAAYLELGAYIGITGWVCDERRGGPLRDLVASIPLDRILIETDAPFLKPRGVAAIPSRGRNEPAYLPYVAVAVAECMGVTAEELVAASTANAVRLFGEAVAPR
ncbi:TatD family Hydrolase [Thecamonas trahens ATCC 50062]|uniref:TatD family Hydrolase n=1 Tax=Thecamonas trahens ATCC 50062 TaxID=461836 RepID=A0A0L0DAZ8_THETB|nr:TatD family Hydrolase [Thecamonas trahens ATCC 50062]KNC49507.1 TatD family Hydrolase [Thecamonas trahens ATCC 50062]|eukprot:XP_013757624.1 TatD family Hydrolase [Thecamonas trahens ATCC 50062]